MTEALATPAHLLRDRLMSSRIARDFIRSRTAGVAAVVFFALVVLAVLAPFITLQNPYDLSQLNLLDARLAPMERGFDGDLYLLGTDQQGRDMTSAIIYGLRISLFVAIVRSVIALVVGTLLGMLDGMARSEEHASELQPLMPT